MNCYRCATPLPDNSRFCFSCGADVSGETAQHAVPVERDPELEAKLIEDVKGDFVIERLLGRGGMAAVFLARDTQLDRKVAIKVLPPELTFGPGMVERFKREARTAATLDHPHIVPIYRIAKGGKLFWFAMKYIEGESLADVLEREKSISAERAARILSQVAEALEFAHQHGIVHRDIKPANVMIDPRGWVTVTDFGIAKAVGSQSLTGSGSMIGTPYYMSPEQCAGKKTLTGASDQYSLGVLAYLMLSGHLPFTGEAAVDIIKQHCFDPVPPLAVLKPGLSRALVTAVERTLAKKPEDRFLSVGEFAQAFEAAARGAPAAPLAPQPGQGRPSAETAPIPAWPKATPVERPAPPPRAPVRARARRRGRRNLILGALGSVVAVGLAGVLLWPRLSEQPSRTLAGAPAGARPESTVVSVAPAHESTAVQQAAPPTSVVTAPLPTPVVTARPETTRPRPAAPAPTRRAPRNARLFLRGASGDATITLDGQRMRDSALSLKPGERHIVTVTKSGYEPWVDTLFPAEGEQLARWVQLRERPAAAVAQAPAAPPTAAASPAESGFVSVGTRPQSLITVNGRLVTGNPVTKYKVPAGEVRLHFQVADSSGVWSVDTVVTVPAGQHVNLKRIPLVKRP